MEVLSLVKHATNPLRFFCKSGFMHNKDKRRAHKYNKQSS